MPHPALYESLYAPPADHEHFVPEGWEESDRGLCPCGEAVRWRPRTDRWVPDRTLRVLVLTAGEAASVVDRLSRAGNTRALPAITAQLAAQEEV